MKHLLFILLLLFSISAYAQIDSVIVEKYYISDVNDATDTSGGILKAGSTTYRIYIDLTAGSKLTKIYGSSNHALKIISDSIFFNHAVEGKSFGYQISKNRFNDNPTVALDTWLTLGLAATKYFGVLKRDDKDSSSILGGTKSGGLLVNNDPSVGKPLTSVDGFTIMTPMPSASSFASGGNINTNIPSDQDSTIFGSALPGTQFISYNASLQNSGVMGSTPDNRVLVAQLTTKGKISFELNVEVMDSVGKTMNYVANDSSLKSGETLNRYLKYPFAKVCGCPNTNYLEYKKDIDCQNMDSCKTPIVIGCMDPYACNFDPKANFPKQPLGSAFRIDLCCYPGYCNDRDISLVCPSLDIEATGVLQMNLYPNPAQDKLSIQISSLTNEETTYSVYDSFGTAVLTKNAGIVSDSINDVNVSALPNGLYVLRLFKGGASTFKRFMKN